MKNKKLIFSLFVIFLLAGSLSLNAQVKKTHQGDWSF